MCEMFTLSTTAEDPESLYLQLSVMLRLKAEIFQPVFTLSREVKSNHVQAFAFNNSSLWDLLWRPRNFEEDRKLS